jgi:hypothetical protein
VIQSISGRILENPPKVRSGSDRIVLNDLRKVDLWLWQSGLDEATANHDEWVTILFKNLNPKKLTNGDRGLINQYLFGDSEGIKWTKN